MGLTKVEQNSRETLRCFHRGRESLILAAAAGSMWGTSRWKGMSKIV